MYAFVFGSIQNLYKWNSLKNFKRPVLFARLKSTQWRWIENIGSSMPNKLSQNLDSLSY